MGSMAKCLRILCTQGRCIHPALGGVTLGSLQVTCSRLGISLRRASRSDGIGLLPARQLCSPEMVGPVPVAMAVSQPRAPPAQFGGEPGTSAVGTPQSRNQISLFSRRLV